MARRLDGLVQRTLHSLSGQIRSISLPTLHDRPQRAFGGMLDLPTPLYGIEFLKADNRSCAVMI
jgi:hypothetical protein